MVLLRAQLPFLPLLWWSCCHYRYDGGGWGEAPTAGNMTKDSVNTGTAWIDLARNVLHDRYGRVTSTEDGIGRVTRTAFTQNSDGLTASAIVTNPAGHQTATALDVRRGLPASLSDANGKTTNAVYDPLGRLTAVTRPGNTIGLPDLAYTYLLSQTAPSYVRRRGSSPLTAQ